jgi:hypothetical protein
MTQQHFGLWTEIEKSGFLLSTTLMVKTIFRQKCIPNSNTNQSQICEREKISPQMEKSPKPVIDNP